MEILRSRIEEVWHRQKESWPTLAKALAALRAAQVRPLPIDGAEFRVQCNPARMTSTVAPMDPEAVKRRPCFLCALPEPQEQTPYGPDWFVLCNIAPIAEPHFTIIARAHRPQLLLDAFDPMLRCATDLGETYVVFYNGPLAGASAPDHLHSQAVLASALPCMPAIEALLVGPGAWTLARDERVRIAMQSPPAVPCVALAAKAEEPLRAALPSVLAALGRVAPAAPEPKLNFFVRRGAERITAWFYPRTRPRPHNYGHGHGRYLISPGALDMAGILVVPRPEDFARLDASAAARILADVTIEPPVADRLRRELESL